MGAYLGYQHWLRFLVMFGLCVKGIEEGSLEKNQLHLLDDLNTFPV